MRKLGKLPEEKVCKACYEKEYGKDYLCILKSEEYQGKRFLFVDDIYATGGTYQAAKELCQQVGGTLIGGIVVATILDFWKQEKQMYSLYEIQE